MTSYATADDRGDDDRGASSSAGSMDLSLGTLVAHFVASKQSLSATAHVHRASDIVNTARTIIEDIAALSAKNRFLRSSIDRQLTILGTVRHGLESVYQDGAAEFKALVKRLDAAGADMNKATAELRDTRVEACFRPDGEEPRSLHSFVDEHAVDALHAAFRECLDDFHIAHEELKGSNAAFDAEILDLESTLRDSAHESAESISSSSEPSDSPSALFRSLESHATEMADLLQSLVKHYDLCITALKHTEGGAPAAQAALPAADADPQLDPSQLASPPAPISAAERADLMAVLTADAAEVSPVVAELTARAGDMGTSLVRLSARLDAQTAARARSTSAIAALDALGARLPSYTRASAAFAARWAAVRARIADALAELAALRAFFAAFRRAYDGLLLEVGRRRDTRARMDRIAADARAAIARLYDAERAARDVFQAESGEYLPADLWPGFVEPPTRYEIGVIDDGTRDIPVLPEGVLERVRRNVGRK